MKKFLVALLTLCLALCVCATAEEVQPLKIVEVVNYCEVLEPGEVITAVRVELPEAIPAYTFVDANYTDGWDMSLPFTTNYDADIKAAYVNTTGVKGDVEGAGQYVFLEFDQTSALLKSTYKNHITFDEPAKTRSLRPIRVALIRDLVSVNGNVISGGHAQSSREIRAIVDDFECINWVDEETGVDYDILLYTPAGYDGTTAFPLVIHFTNGGDASYADYSGKRVGALISHTDAVTWADPASQEQWPSFVMAYGKDSEDAIDARIQMAMIQYVLDNYNIDMNRVYAVSLAGATPRLFECAQANPDLFAALVYCSYDPLHVYKDMDLAIENYMNITNLFATWAVVSEADATGALAEGVVPPEMQAAGKGARLGNFALMLNAEHGANITVAGNNGDMPMWNGLLRGDEAAQLAKDLVALGQAKGSDDYVSVFVAGTTPFVDHWSWANGYINMGLHEWLFQQSK